MDKKLFSSYRTFEKLGEDRIANIYYCLHFLRSASIVFDIGTAINVDIFDGKSYMGGYIISGFDMERRALQKDTSLIRIKEKRNFILKSFSPGVSTEECINKGIAISKISFIESCIKEVKRNIKRRFLAVVLTGGGCSKLKNLRCFDITDRDVTLKGLAAALLSKKIREKHVE